MKSNFSLPLIDQIAKDTLTIIEQVANKAERELEEIANSRDDIYGANSMTGDRTQYNREDIRSEARRYAEYLLKSPTYARVDVTDIDEKYCLSFYVAAAGCTGIDFISKNPNHKIISYHNRSLGPISIASLNYNDEIEFEGKQYYVTQKLTYLPKKDAQDWDGIEVSFEYEDVKSPVENLRSLANVVDFGEYFAVQLEMAKTVDGQLNQFHRNLRLGISLRSKAFLDKEQELIFREDIDSQKILLGPPGTGKTTTLIKRLGLKISIEEDIFSPDEQKILKKMGKKSFADWIMFTPSDLLKGYLKEAFASEGIAAPDSCIKVWDSYAVDLAKKYFNILNSGNYKNGFIYRKGLSHSERNDSECIKANIIDDPREWYGAFNDFINVSLKKELVDAWDDLEKANQHHNYVLTDEIKKIIFSNKGLKNKYQNLFELSGKIKALINEEKESSDKILQQELNRTGNNLPDFVPNFGLFLKKLEKDSQSDEDEDENSEFDIDEEDIVSRNDVAVQYKRFLRGFSRNKYLNQKIKANSKNAKIAEWLGNLLPKESILIELGRSAALQNSLRRYESSWKHYYTYVTKLYKKFKKASQAEKFYILNKTDDKKLSQAELLSETYVKRNIIDSRFKNLLDFSQTLFKDQVLVDEATDFSVLQLACMEALTSIETKSFFACGDFNQRLTSTGIKKKELLPWVSTRLNETYIDIVYRQTPSLNHFSHQLLEIMSDSDKKASAKLPKGNTFSGLNPALLEDTYGDWDCIAKWITDRIINIEEIINWNQADTQVFPTIVVLTKNEEDVQPMTDTLVEYLEEYNLTAVACLDGKRLGEEGDIHVCSIQYIKGLEFEAVFFVDIDELKKIEADLYQKYLYVGATRAATFLGITCSRNLPDEMESMRELFVEDWGINQITEAAL